MKNEVEVFKKIYDKNKFKQDKFKNKRLIWLF